MIGKFPRLTLAALIALSAPVALIHPTTAATAQSGDRTSYVLFSQGGNDTTMSGSMEDMERARRLRSGREAMLFARVDGVFYVVRDPATLRRAYAIFAPQQAMGARQAEMGSRQAALGARQAALGAQQARLGAQQHRASPRRIAQLERQQSELGRQQSALGEQQGALGDRQAALGREQARLGREAQVQLRRLLADAIRSGTAQRVN